jgi:nicotinamidase-related amidase
MLPRMNEPFPIERSGELMSAGDTALVVVDVQEKLIPLIAAASRMVWNIERLLDGAKILGVPAIATEQYPQGLGSTIESLASRLDGAHEKIAFSAVGCAPFAALREQGVFRVLLVGIETHVCVQQTALDLIAAGFRVYVAVDAVGARNDVDCEVALRRMETTGVTLTTTEAALFEWCQVAGTAEFKQISQLVRLSGPSAN